jgi:hypothetical protein
VAALAGALKGWLGLAGVFEIAAGILFVSGLMLFRVRGSVARYGGREQPRGASPGSGIELG